MLPGKRPACLSVNQGFQTRGPAGCVMRPGLFFLQKLYNHLWGFVFSTRPFQAVAYQGILFAGGGSSTNSVEDRGQRDRGSGGDSPLVRGSGDSCNLVQEISFHIVKFS